MHELSVALEICRMAEERLGQPATTQLRAVGVEVGDDAGVEIANLEFCLETLLSQPPFGHARAAMLRRPGADLRLAYLEIDDGDPHD